MLVVQETRNDFATRNRIYRFVLAATGGVLILAMLIDCGVAIGVSEQGVGFYDGVTVSLDYSIVKLLISVLLPSNLCIFVRCYFVCFSARLHSSACCLRHTMMRQSKMR